MLETVCSKTVGDVRLLCAVCDSVVNVREAGVDFAVRLASVSFSVVLVLIRRSA
jgi:hypothetical protein